MKLGQVGNLVRDTVELCSRSCKPHLYVPWTFGVLKKKNGVQKEQIQNDVIGQARNRLWFQNKKGSISTSLAKRCAGKEKS